METSTGRPRRRRRQLVAGTVVVAVVAWLAVRWRQPDEATTGRPAAVVDVAPSAATGVTPAGPLGDSSGVPTGYAHTVAGAQVAAVGWVSSLGALVDLGPIAAADALRAVTSDRVAAATVDSFGQERARFRERFGVDASVGIWIEAPLAVAVTDWSPEQATARVWSQVVMGVPGDSSVTVLWRTHTLRLVWEHDDWKVDDTTTSEGPTPRPVAEDLPSTGDEFTAVAAWTPAVLAASIVKGDGS